MSFANTQRHRFTVTFTPTSSDPQVLRLLAKDAPEATLLAARQLWGRSATWHPWEGSPDRGHVQSKKFGTVEVQVTVQVGYVR